MESSGKSYAHDPTAFLHGNSRQRGGTLGAGLAQLPAPGCQEPSSRCSGANCQSHRAAQPSGCSRPALLLPAGCAAAGASTAPASLSHAHGCWVPWNGSSHPGLWFGIYCSSSGVDVAIPVPILVPGQIAGMKWLLRSQGFPVHIPSCLFVQGPFSTGVLLHCEPLFAEWGEFPDMRMHLTIPCAAGMRGSFSQPVWVKLMLSESHGHDFPGAMSAANTNFPIGTGNRLKRNQERHVWTFGDDKDIGCCRAGAACLGNVSWGAFTSPRTQSCRAPGKAIS